MGRNLTNIPIEFMGGLWETQGGNIYEVPDGYLYEGINLIPTNDAKKLLIRPGFGNSAPSGWPSTVVFDWGMVDNIVPNVPKIVGSVGTSIYSGQLNDVLTNTYTAPAAIKCGVQYKTLIYFSHGSSAVLYQFTGAANPTIIAGSPNALHLEVHKDRLFAVSATTNYRLHFSDAATFTSWPGTNILDVNANDGESVIAIKSLGDKLVIFKQRSIWVLYVTGSPVNWRLSLVTSLIGCVDFKSVVEINGLIYFLSNNGVYRTDGTIVELISQAIQAQTLETGPSTGFGGRYQDFYIITVPNGFGPLLYHIPTGTWWRWTLGLTCYMGFFNNVYQGAINRNTFVALPVSNSAPSGAYIFSIVSDVDSTTSAKDTTATFPYARLTTGYKKVASVDNWLKVSHLTAVLSSNFSAGTPVILPGAYVDGTQYTAPSSNIPDGSDLFLKIPVMKHCKHVALTFEVRSLNTGIFVVSDLEISAVQARSNFKRTTP